MKKTPEPKLPDAEWAFHLVPTSERVVCLYHEKSRVLAAGQVLGWDNKPWQDLATNTKRFTMDLLRPTDNKRPPERREDRSKKDSSFEKLCNRLQCYAAELARRSGSEWKLPVEIVHREIDWRTNDTKLKENFKNFIRDERSKPVSAAAQYKDVARTAGTGRKPAVEQSLVNIAIVRAAAAGYKRREVVELLTPMLKSFRLLNEDWEIKNGPFSEKNWAATLKRAKASLAPK